MSNNPHSVIDSSHKSKSKNFYTVVKRNGTLAPFNRERIFYAIEAAQKDAAGINPQALFVGNMLAPMISGQAHLGALIADFAGMRGIEAYTTEAAGASGAAALRAGYLAVKSGLVDSALVVGVEKMTACNVAMAVTQSDETP